MERPITTYIDDRTWQRLEALGRSNGLTVGEQAHRLLVDAVARPGDEDEDCVGPDDSLWDVVERLRRKYSVRLHDGELEELPSSPPRAVDFSGPEYGAYDDEPDRP